MSEPAAESAGAGAALALTGALAVTFMLRAAGIVYAIRLPPGGTGER